MFQLRLAHPVSSFLHCRHYELQKPSSELEAKELNSRSSAGTGPRRSTGCAAIIANELFRKIVRAASTKATALASLNERPLL
jgi:hypothetical protein